MREEFRQAREDELEAVYALRGRAFGEGDPEGNRAAWFAAHDRDDPWRAEGANYVATCAGEVVATLRIFARRIGMGAEELAVAGFGDVATDPAYQGRGYMRRLLEYVNGENRAHGFALGLLFTGVRGVYAAAGFRPLPAFWYTLALPAGTLPEAVPATTAVGVEGWTIVPGGPEHVGAMRAVYEAFGRGRPGYPVRDDAYWAHWERASVRRSGAWLRVAIDGSGRVGAYLRAGLWDGQDVGILEWPYTPDAAEAVSLVLAALVADPIAQGKRTINGALPRDHIAYAFGGSLCGTLSVADHMMVRAYTSCGAQLEELLRGETEGRSVYWAADYF